MYDKKDFSYGSELEFADVDRFKQLPDGCNFDNKDHTVVNSNGIATDPKAKTSPIGGEINVRPTNTIEEQVEVIKEIIDCFQPNIKVNYRCNLHIHVRVNGLKEDLESCKKLLRYINENQDDVFRLVEPIPKPTSAEYPNPEELKGAMKRYKRRHRSHQFKMYPKTYEKIMNEAKTVEDFFNFHVPYSEELKRPLLHLVPRCGINLRPLWEAHHNTIEFRHFPGTLNEEEYKSCLWWCREFLDCALNTGKPVVDLYNENKNWLKFPKFEPYNHAQEQIYLLTSYDHNTRKEIEQNLKTITPLC